MLIGGVINVAQEKNFENKVKKFLDEQGAWYVKFFANAYTRSGIPDLLCCVNGYFVAIEVKAQNGHATALQVHHCTEIRISGGFAFILYPSGFEEFKQFIYGLGCDRFTRDMPLILK